jgi:hypothetical protein
MSTTAIAPEHRGERRYRAYERAIRKRKQQRHFRHGLNVTFIGVLIGVICGLIIAAW